MKTSPDRVDDLRGSAGDPAGRYPPQEPLSEAGEKFARRMLALSAGLAGHEIRYGEHPSQTLTIFNPPSPNGIVLLFFHGGGWTNGYKEWMYFMAPALNAQGVTFASATYRLAPQHVFPDGFSDCADAVACVHREAARALGEDAALFVGGHSAGGHYAALLAVTNSWQAERGLPDDVLKGCLPISGTYRFGEGSGLKVRPRFLGSDPETERRAAPLSQLGGATPPPFFLSYGSDDFPHLIRQAGEMEAALRSAGASVHVETIDQSDHFEAGFAAGDPQQPWLSKALAWMSERRRER